MGPAEQPIPDAAPVLRGRQVTIGDVTPYAKPSHNACGGRGYFERVTVAGKPAGAIPCACAFKRFVRAKFKDVEIMPKGGDVYWRPGREPENVKA